MSFVQDFRILILCLFSDKEGQMPPWGCKVVIRSRNRPDWDTHSFRKGSASCIFSLDHDLEIQTCLHSWAASPSSTRLFKMVNSQQSTHSYQEVCQCIAPVTATHQGVQESLIHNNWLGSGMIHTGLAAINQSVLRTALALVSDKWIRHGSMEDLAKREPLQRRFHPANHWKTVPCASKGDREGAWERWIVLGLGGFRRTPKHITRNGQERNGPQAELVLSCLSGLGSPMGWSFSWAPSQGCLQLHFSLFHGGT